ncbi:MAG: hypothetical protein K8S23_04040 [Candidatus Cloacimonetes bacterium]|nr:hypothetical protein [Candidatus Cloacimonadota bacterium]
MNNELKTMYEMQKIDDIIAQKLILKKDLPLKLNSLKENMKNTTEEWENLKNTLDANLTDQKMRELDIKTNQAQSAKYKNQLLTIKSNKEYKALNKEILHLEKKNAKIDDNRVEMMLEEENLREQIIVAKQNQAKAAKDLKENENKIEQQIVDVNNNIDELKLQRNSLAKSNLSRQMISRYASLIKFKNRKAIVFNEKGACSVCGIKLRPQMIIEIKRGEKITKCENCGRMFVAKPEDEE